MTQDLRATIVAKFAAERGSAPKVLARAPGRLEVLGNHTDYNEGFVLSTATGFATWFALTPVKGRRCRLSNYDFGNGVEFDLDDLDNPKAGDWSNYVKGVIVELRERGHEVGAFDGAIMSTVPLSAGMSSSAALEISTCYALSKAFGVELPREDWARIGQRVENAYVGVNSGLLDQFSSIFGEHDRLILCDFRSVKVLKTVPLPEGYVFVVANTMVKHNLVDSAYNARRVSCEAAAAAIAKRHVEVKALRDVSMPMLEECAAALDFTDYRRAKHVVGEDERVMAAVDALGRGDVAAFGALLFESHQSSVDNFENSCQELDYLVAMAKTLPGCLGARLSGGGFGGISIHLVEADKAEAYAERLRAAFKVQTGIDCNPLVCPSGDGAAAELL